MLDVLAELKQDRDDAEWAYREYARRVLNLMEKRSVKTVNSGHRKYTAVASERAIVDEAKLREAVGEEVWTRITDQKLNRSKLDEAIMDGSLDPTVYAQHLTVKRGAPHIRITDDTE